MAVAIMPGLFMAVVAAGRNQLIHNGRHVSLQPGLELNRTDRRCAADVEDIGNSSFDTQEFTTAATCSVMSFMSP